MLRGILSSCLLALGFQSICLGASSAGLSLDQQEQFLATAIIRSQQKVNVGVTGSRRATLSDGIVSHDAHIQSVDVEKTRARLKHGDELDFRDTWKFNVAAYRLAKLLGFPMVPPSVERRTGNLVASLTWWVDDVSMDEGSRRQKNVTPPDPQEWSKQVEVQRVFDELIYNTDRNFGNLLITKDWKLWLIDHTRSFRRHSRLKSPHMLNRCDRTLLTALEHLDRRDVDRELKPYLRGAEIDALMKRRDELVKLFAERRRQYGDEAILFDLRR